MGQYKVFTDPCGARLSSGSTSHFPRVALDERRAMAIECPRCGRHYDVTLFSFGRTIRCTCGARVGREKLERRLDGRPELRFLCDAMLGRLARWLRALGYDAAYDSEIEDADLVRRAVEEERVILTRDRDLVEAWRIEGCLALESDDPLENLAAVDRELGLGWPRPLFRRCLACNVAFEPAPPEEVEAHVPERVRRRETEFRRCPGCERIYWEGSHTRRMRRRLEGVLGGG